MVPWESCVFRGFKVIYIMDAPSRGDVSALVDDGFFLPIGRIALLVIDA